MICQIYVDAKIAGNDIKVSRFFFTYFEQDETMVLEEMIDMQEARAERRNGEAYNSRDSLITTLEPLG
jgi:hypothetical protein